MYFRLFFWTIINIVFQVFILNYLQIEGYGTPLACTLTLLVFPLSTPRWITLLTGFLIGIIEDMFICTPGISAASFTFLAMIQPYLLKAFSHKNEDEDGKSMAEIINASVLGWRNYIIYITISTLLTCIVFFSLQFFSFFNFMKYLLCIGSSWLTTTLFILAIEVVRISNKKAANR